VRGDGFSSAQAGLLAAKYAAKKAQLAAYRKRSAAGGGAIVLATGAPVSGSFAADPALEALARGVCLAAGGSGPGVCLLCGPAAGVFPAWG
jgi:hypothetical protein